MHVAHEVRFIVASRLAIPLCCDGGLHGRRCGLQKAALDQTHVTKEPIAMTFPATMRALQQTSLNGPKDLRLVTDMPAPSPNPGDVLIRVTAAASTSSISRRPAARLRAARNRRTWRASRAQVSHRGWRGGDQSGASGSAG